MKILVVDDEQTNRQVIERLLAKEGHEVFLANDGVEGVAEFEDKQPDLVIMDVMMPNMDGYEAASIIKEKSKDTFIPIIFLTALENEKALIRSLESGGDDFIAKPFKTTVLLAKIAAMSRIRELHLTLNAKNQELIDLHKINQRELVVAEEIFNNVLDAGNTDLDILHIFHKPAENFNGDIALAVKSPRGCLHVMLGDFTGHGLAAAMCTMPVVDAFKKMTVKGYSLEQIIKEIARKINQYLPTDRFFASCFLSVDPREKTLKIWNGGMPDVYLISPENGIYETITSDRLPLGITNPEDIDTTLQVYSVEQKDKIFAYSDGLIELEVTDKKMFGDDQLQALINKNRKSCNIVTHIENAIKPHLSANPIKDDLTFIEVCCDFSKLSQIRSEKVMIDKLGNWKLSVEFDAKTLKGLDPIPVFLAMLDEMQEYRMKRDSLITVLSEMFSNALEHGLLGMSSVDKKSPEGFMQYYDKLNQRLDSLETGGITVTFTHTLVENGSELNICMEDTGNGFNVETVLKSLKQDKAMYGRGIYLMQHLCKDLWYNQKGNQANVTLEWNRF